MDQNKTEKIAKLIAQSGLCSRRDAEVLIAEGRVKVAGEIVTTPAMRLEDPSLIKVDERFLPKKQATRLWIYYKPVGLVTTHKDPEGRPTVFSSLPKDLERVISVGRLDLNSEGLLLLTNDGAFARFLELPSTLLKRIYRVQVYGDIGMLDINQLSQGITIDGMRYQGMSVKILQHKNMKSWLRFELSEGKNREIRNVLSYFGLRVTKLIRDSYGPFSIEDLQPGQIEEYILDRNPLYQRYLANK